MTRPSRFAIALLAAAAWSAPWPAAAATPAAPPAAAGSQAPQVLRFEPRGRRLSNYDTQIRYELSTSDITFEVPPAYRESFAFWTGRLKGQRTIELIQLLVRTQDAAEDGSIPFRRTAPRFQVETEQGGKSAEPLESQQREVAGLVWEGLLDRYGNVKEVRVVEGKESPDFAALTLRYMQHALPGDLAPRDIRVGEGFVETFALPLPSRLHIAGLENVGVVATREYVLKEIAGDRASFQVKANYTSDPATAPTAPGTVCRVSGGGNGEATFDVRRGVFLAARMPTTMTIEIEAPLKPLPDRPDTAKGGTGRTTIVLGVHTSAEQSVKRPWGSEDD